MTDHVFAVQAAFERAGVPSEVLPEPDRESVDVAMKYVSGKECYPCTVTTGDMLKKVFSPDFRPDESAFFMPSGSGPCRFGQYNVFHKQILEGVGFDTVPILSPNQDSSLFKDLGLIGDGFIKDSWSGIVAIDLLQKCLHETRPYEKEKGMSDELYDEFLSRLWRVMKNGRSGQGNCVNELLKDANSAFSVVPKYKCKKPLIGIIGEIYVRANRFANEELIRKVEALGGEALLAPLEEWMFYLNASAFKKALWKRDVSEIISICVKNFYQKRVEHNYASFFEGFLKNLNEPTTKELLRKAAPYVHDSFEGETVLSIGKAVDLSERGAAGVINAMPFGCMPGTIVTALLRGVTKQYGLPAISIPYDGTESTTLVIQLEAFMDQAKSRFKN
jgi:predicted nucleotide-binding protein (sugar kinase/HSP70/actin superfamily)